MDTPYERLIDCVNSPLWRPFDERNGLEQSGLYERAIEQILSAQKEFSPSYLPGLIREYTELHGSVKLENDEIALDDPAKAKFSKESEEKILNFLTNLITHASNELLDEAGNIHSEILKKFDIQSEPDAQTQSEVQSKTKSTFIKGFFSYLMARIFQGAKLSDSDNQLREIHNLCFSKTVNNLKSSIDQYPRLHQFLTLNENRKLFIEILNDPAFKDIINPEEYFKEKTIKVVEQLVILFLQLEGMVKREPAVNKYLEEIGYFSTVQKKLLEVLVSLQKNPFNINATKDIGPKFSAIRITLSEKLKSSPPRVNKSKIGMFFSSAKKITSSGALSKEATKILTDIHEKMGEFLTMTINVMPRLVANKEPTVSTMRLHR